MVDLVEVFLSGFRISTFCPSGFISVRAYHPLRHCASALGVFLIGAFMSPAMPAQGAEPLQVQPGRVFLGSLAYGATDGHLVHKSVTITHPPGDWVPTHVDLSKAPGVQARWERTSATTLRLDLEIDTAGFTVGQPYGALVKRWVRVETPLEEAPQVLIPILGMTSENATARDFSTFQFQGRTRWQGWWATPNIAGSVLAVVAVLGAGVAGWFGRRARAKQGQFTVPQSKLSLFGSVFAAGVAGVCLFGLTLTYSRGAWVACAVGLGMLLVLMRGRRMVILALMAAWGLMLVGMPEGLSRAGSAVRVQDDKSIKHRLHVWEGALQMMAEHPLRGAGAGQFGEVFPRLYQRAGHKESYSTAISDWFTWAAERGVIVAGLWTGLMAFLLGGGLVRAWRHSGTATAPFTAALLTLAVACGFSTLGFVREIQFLWGFLAVVLVGAAVLQEMRKARSGQDVQPSGQDARAPLRKGPLCRTLAVAGACCLVACLLWWGAGQWALGRLPTRTACVSSSIGPIWVVQPRQGEVCGLVWYFPGQQEDEATHLRTTLRPLAAQGWIVVGALKADVPVEVLRLAEMEARIDPRLPRHWAGHREGAAAAWRALGMVATAERPHTLAMFGFKAPEWHPHGSEPWPWLIVVHSVWDDQASLNAVVRWVRAARAAGWRVESRWIDEEVSRNRPMWQEWLTDIGKGTTVVIQKNDLRW